MAIDHKSVILTKNVKKALHPNRGCCTIHIAIVTEYPAASFRTPAGFFLVHFPDALSSQKI